MKVKKDTSLTSISSTYFHQWMWHWWALIHDLYTYWYLTFLTNWHLFSEAVVQRCSAKSVLRNFTKFTGKHLYLHLRPATLLKRRLWHRCFPVNLVKFLRTPFFIEHLWLLLLFFGIMNSVSLSQKPGLLTTSHIILKKCSLKQYYFF